MSNTSALLIRCFNKSLIHVKEGSYSVLYRKGWRIVELWEDLESGVGGETEERCNWNLVELCTV